MQKRRAERREVGWILTDDKVSSLAFILYREGRTVWFLGRLMTYSDVLFRKKQNGILPEYQLK